MNSSLIKNLPVVVLLGSSVLWGHVALAAEGTEAPTAIPATADGIWQAIDKHVELLDSAIARSKLDGVHLHAYAVRDLVRALPTHSPNLAADALTKVKQQSKFVDTLAERLDQTGDANDKPATEANLHKLEGVLKHLRAEYPGLK
jgi:hypothetical protein